MAIQLKREAPKTMRLTAEDKRIMEKLQRKTGLKLPQVIRMALRKLAEHEGIKVA